MIRTLLYRILLFGGILVITNCDNTTPVPDISDEPDIIDPDFTEYEACLDLLSDNTLDVVTWNIEWFSNSNTNTTMLAEMIILIDADIIGVQEISKPAHFNAMIDRFDGWESEIIESSDLNLGFTYKTSEITLNGSLLTIFNDNWYPFPRPPVVGNFTHTPSGTTFTVINLHLKCCGGNENEDRRREASILLKDYIDNNLATTHVLVVGDYNDEIQEPVDTNVFQVLIDDAANYQFADMVIATGSNTEFSYPSWNPPSHLDHILMTNEFFDSWESTTTLKLDECKDRYEFDISDHRPVMARFRVN